MPRELRFKTIAEVEAELDRLEGRQVRTTGVWSFAQILEHIAEGTWWALSEGEMFAAADGVFNAKPELKRKLFERMVRSGTMPVGFINPAAPTARVEGDPAPAFKRLREGLARLKTYGGPYPEHPVFGTLSTEEWKTWCAMHCAHHLNFAEPLN